MKHVLRVRRSMDRYDALIPFDKILQVYKTNTSHGEMTVVELITGGKIYVEETLGAIEAQMNYNERDIQ